MGPRRVLHLIWSLDLGGAERQVVELVRGTDRRRFEPIVGCLVRKGKWGEALEAEGVCVLDFGKKPGFDLRLPLELARYMRSHRVDIVHTHAFTAASSGRAAAALARGVAVVAHEHSALSLSSAKMRLVDRALVPFTDRFIVVSRALARDLVDGIGMPQDKVSIVPNGIRIGSRSEADRAAVRSALLPPGTNRLIGCVGRLEARKGLDVFIDAVAGLGGESGDVGAVIVGEGPLERDLRLRARSLGVEGRIVFAGRREDIADVLSALDVYALPSYTEGLSISLLEAAVAGRPIVATRVGGNAEVITDGATGRLVPPGDAGQLASALSELLSRPGKAHEMGRRAADNARQRFSAQRMLDEVHAIYEDVLALRKGADRGGFRKARPIDSWRRRLSTRVRSATALPWSSASDGVSILTYHRINDSHPGDGLSVHPLAFARQLELLLDASGRVVPLSEAIRAVGGGGGMPRGAVAITFDSCLRDAVDVAMPILESFGVVATFFLETRLIGSSRAHPRYVDCCARDTFLGWDQVRQLEAAGHSIGVCGRALCDVGGMAEGAAREEIIGARDDVVRELGTRPTAFSCRAESVGTTLTRLIEEAGFAAICTGRAGRNPMGTSVYSLARVGVFGHDSLSSFRAKLGARGRPIN